MRIDNSKPHTQGRPPERRRSSVVGQDAGALMVNENIFNVMNAVVRGFHCPLYVN